MSLSHETVYLCDRIANTSGLPELARLIVDPIAQAARSAATGIADEKLRLATLDHLVTARDEAVRILTGLMHVDAHRRAIIADMKADMGVMRDDMVVMRDETKEALQGALDVLDKMRVETERVVMKAVTETMKSSEPIAEHRYAPAS